MKPRRSRTGAAKQSRRRVTKLKSVKSIRVDGDLPAIPSPIVGLTAGVPTWNFRSEVAGVPLPKDLREAIDAYATALLQEVRKRLTTPPWTWHPGQWTQAERDAWQPMADDNDWQNLGYYLGDAFRQGFYLALLRYGEQLRCVAEVVEILKDKKENGEMLAAEGRRAKAEADATRAELICRLWTTVRLGFPRGRAGNGSALRAVVERFEASTHRKIGTAAVRKTLQNRGIWLSK